MNLVKQLLPLFLLVSLTYSTWAKEVVPQFSASKEYQYINDEDLPAFIDRERAFNSQTILDVTDWNYNASKFEYSTDLDANIWFRFQLDRQEHKKGLVLHLYNGLIPLFKVYKKENNQLVLIDSLGSLFPHQQRANAYRDAIIELPFQKGVTYYYFMVNAKYYNGFDIAIRSYENLFNYAIKEYYLLGAFYGILMLVFLYNLFYYLQIKDKLYLFYLLYILVAIIASASTDLTGYWKLWPNHPTWNKFLVDQSKWLLSASFVLYAVYFLRLKSLGKVWFNAVALTSGIYILYNLLVINLWVDTRIFVFLFLLSVHLTVLWVSAYKSWRSGSTSSGIFLIGLSTMVLAFSGQYLRFWEFIPVTVATHFIMHYGILAEVLVLSYAMSYKFKQERILRIEALELKTQSDQQLIHQLKLNEELNDKVNQELEEKVKEKTADLQKANQKLQIQAENIQSINEQLAKLNGVLYNDKKKQQHARIVQKNMSLEEFSETFPSKIECYHLLNDLKSAHPFACKKCGNTQFTKGPSLLSKRCTKCGYNESITTGTLFKGFRSPLPNGFYLVYLLVESGFKISSTELAHKSDLGIKTAWKLHKDILEKLGEKHSKNWIDYLIF